MTVGFISEMSALPVLGGGVTLRRVLGDELDQFDWFLKTIQYDTEPVPEYTRGNSYYTPFGAFQKSASRFLGCRVSWWLTSNKFSREVYYRRVVRDFRKHAGSLSNSKVLVCPNSIATLKVFQRLRHQFHFPYISWVMDDHMVQWKDGQWTYPANVESLFAEHLRKAEMVFVISPAMQQLYRQKFGIESTVLCSPACADEVSTPTASSTNDPTVRLAYFGSLGRWQNDALAPLAEFVARGEVALDIYSQQPDLLPKELLDAGVKLCGQVRPDEVLPLTRNYDAIVLPVSFEAELRNMTCLNIATKFSECLATSVPTLLIAPTDAAMVSIARCAGACVIVNDLSYSAFSEAIQEIRNPNFFHKKVIAEHSLLRSEFTPEIMSERWRPASEFLFNV